MVERIFICLQMAPQMKKKQKEQIEKRLDRKQKNKKLQHKS